jgi:alpha-D-ribose 1-methylphosphonate 5-triphosphate synthase subunit PhnI
MCALQALARGDEGFLLAMGYSTQRGYGGSHPFAGEVRMGEVRSKSNRRNLVSRSISAI